MNTDVYFFFPKQELTDLINYDVLNNGFSDMVTIIGRHNGVIKLMDTIHKDYYSCYFPSKFERDACMTEINDSEILITLKTF